VTTRSSEIAGTLERRIAEGEFHVGHLLPTESELCQEYGVSRFTVREALRRLDEAGLIERRQGSGTRVISTRPDLTYSASMSDAADVLRYAGETILEPLTEWKVPTAGEQRTLDLDEREGWLVRTGLRRLVSDQSIIGLATIAVRAELQSALASIDLAQPRALFAQLVDAADLRVVRIDQEISAVALDDKAARHLGEASGSPALVVVRRYEAEGVGCFQVARTLHPSTRFSYRLDLAHR
jgi:GntR family transcriptional regulator